MCVCVCASCVQEDSILHGCIPVIIQDDIDVPLETVLDISQFAIRYPRSKLGELVDFLKAVPPEQVIVYNDKTYTTTQTTVYSTHHETILQRRNTRGIVLEIESERSRSKATVLAKRGALVYNLKAVPATQAIVQIISVQCFCLSYYISKLVSWIVRISLMTSTWRSA